MQFAPASSACAAPAPDGCRRVAGTPGPTACLRARLEICETEARGISNPRGSKRAASHSQELFITTRHPAMGLRKSPATVLEWQAPAEDLVTASASNSIILLDEFITTPDFNQL